ncbi:MAG: hypothetical protein ACFFCW_03170 [Candidatus Hodarchaeota archaeon]
MSSMIQTLKEWSIRSLFEEQGNLSFEIEGRVFSQPRLLCRNNGRILSKAGRISWRAVMDGEKVKIYECHGESQAVFIERVSRHPLLQYYFPTCLMRIGAYLVVKWVEGKQVTWRQVRRDQTLLNQIAGLQALIHANSVETQETSCVFDYIKYLKDRICTFKGIFPLDDIIRTIYITLDENAPLAQERITHPDVTAVNLILEAGSGNLKLVDNELLTQNSYFLIDLFNTHYSFEPRLEGDLLELYLTRYMDNGGDLGLLVQYEDYYCALWYLRLIGSSLEAGAIEKAFRLAQHYIEVGSKAHPLVQLVRERLIK